jgi:hypothetical protein
VRSTEQHRHFDGGDPVDQGVVRLADDRPAPAAQARYQVQPPQWVRGIQRARQQRAGELAQRARATRRGQRDCVDVAGDVEARIVGPVRIAEAEPWAQHPAAEARHVLEAPLDMPAQGRQRRRAPLDADGPADVERSRGAVEVQEGSVERAQAVDRRHAAMIPRVIGPPTVRARSLARRSNRVGPR